MSTSTCHCLLIPSTVRDMDPELDIAGAFVLKEMKSKPWREVAGEHLKNKTNLLRKEQLQHICLFERQRRTGCPCADKA